MALEDLDMTVQLLPILACDILAGTAVYVSFVEQPSRLACGVKVAVTEWRPSYKRGTAMQTPLAVVGSLFAFISWRLEKDLAWLVGAVLLLAVIPFTLIVVFPTNKILEDYTLNSSSARAEQLMRRWGRLHALRTPLSLLAFITFLFAMRYKS